MINILDKPKKFHFLGNNPTIILKCWNVASSGSYAKFQYLIDSAIIDGTMIAVVVNKKEIVFTKGTASNNFMFSSNVDLITKMKNCFYLQDFDISYSYYNDSDNIIATFQSKERNEYSFEMFECSKNEAFFLSKIKYNGKSFAIKTIGSCVSEISRYSGQQKVFYDSYTVAAYWETRSTKTPMAFFSPDKNGIVKIKSSLVESMMGEYHCPIFNLSEEPKRIYVDEKYRVVFGEHYGNPVILQNLQQTEWFYALDGQLTDDFANADMPDWTDSRPDTKINSTENIVRIIGRDTDKNIFVNKSKPEYIYIMVSNESIGDNEDVKVSISMKSIMSDESLTDETNSYSLKNHCIYVFNANANNNNVIYRKISVKTSVECFSTTLIIKPDFYKQFYFLIKNRYGIASVFVSDKLSIEKNVDIENYTIGKRLLNDYFNMKESFKTRLTLKKEEAKEFNSCDFKNAYMEVRGVWKKININTSNIAIDDSDNDMSELEFEFSFHENNINNYITLKQDDVILDESFVDNETIVKL